MVDVKETKWDRGVPVVSVCVVVTTLKIKRFKKGVKLLFDKEFNISKNWIL